MVNKHCKNPIRKNRINIHEQLFKRKVVNISGYSLTTSQTDILAKGLNFSPTPKTINKKEFNKNVDVLTRNLSLKVLFHNENNAKNTPYISTNLQKILRKQNKAPYQPPHQSCVLAYSEAVKDEVQNYEPNYLIKSNISKREANALEALTNRNDIVIKRADKGGATVVCSAAWYENEANRQLNDTIYYKKVPTDDTRKHEEEIANTLKQFSEDKSIDTKLANQLTPVDSRTPEFYMFPKIHKVNNPGRPVISSPGCHTEKISAYVDEYLKPAAQNLPSYIRDTDDFVNKIKKIGKVAKEDILVTLDVSSLYTNIDNNEGIAAIKANATLKSNHSSRIIEMICKLMTLVLTLNNFIFNGQNYHQIKGTAMGTRAAPNYANIFMGQFEHTHILNTDWKGMLKCYCRFIDDIFLIWKNGEESLKEFLELLNNIHPTIKFTSEYSKHKINFLDVIIEKDAMGHLSTDIHKKPTDTHNYLNSNSAHPNHCINSIPFSQFLRIRRIVSDQTRLKRRLDEHIEYFVNSGYPRHDLKKIANNVINLPKERVENSNKMKEPSVRFVTNYNPMLPNMNKLMKKHWPIMETNEKCRKALTKPPQITYKREKNLADILVRAKYRSGSNMKRNGKQLHHVSKCGKCSWCNKLLEGCKFSSIVTGKTYDVLHPMTCHSQWVVYLCECRVHKLQYVGKSETPLNIRMNNNRSHLKKNIMKCELVRHFRESSNCDFEKDLRIMPIEQLRMHSDETRGVEVKKKTLRERETFWQWKLHTLYPRGMNKRQG